MPFGTDALLLTDLDLDGDKAEALNVDAATVEGEDPQAQVWVGNNYGTRFHFGNPFTTHKAGVELGQIKVANQSVAVQEYRAWLMGTRHKLVDIERRQWILNEIRGHQLENKTLHCGCKPDEDGNVHCRCHKQVLLQLMERSEFLHRNRGTDEIFWEMF